MELEEITYKIYKSITEFFNKIGGKKCFLAWLLLFFTILLVGSIYKIYPEVPKEIMNQVFVIISESFLIGILVFFGNIIISIRRELLIIKKLEKIWEEILKVVIFGFSVAILNLIFIIFSDQISKFNLEIPFLFLTFSLVVYLFYIITRRITKSFL